MNDPAAPPAKSREFRTPLLLAAFRRQVDGEPQDGVTEAPPAAAPTDPAAERLRVLTNLITKYLKLDDSGATLQQILNTTADPAEYDHAALRLSETRAEQSMCKARYDAIDAGRPFTDPGPTAEAALLTAMKAVDLATANTAAVGGLLPAAHDLIEAYKAKSTEAAG